MSFQAVLAKMHGRLLTRLGEQALLRGNQACLVNIEFGVAVGYEIGDAKFYQSEYAEVVDVANISAEFSPTPGDTLAVGAKNYVIDAVAANNGHMARCILRGG